MIVVIQCAAGKKLSAGHMLKENGQRVMFVADPQKAPPDESITRDNLEVMRGMADECIDLIYLDPPFNSNHDYADP